MKIKTEYEVWEEEYKDLADRTTKYLLLPFYTFSQLCGKKRKKPLPEHKTK